MEQKTKLELLKEKINALRNRNAELQTETPAYVEPKESKVMRNVATGALIATLAVSVAIGIPEAIVNHATDMCVVSKIISVFDEEAAINHQISGIKSDFKDAENLSVEYQPAHYTAPVGYTVEGDKAVKYVKATQKVIYSVPAGYVLEGTKGVKINSDGTREEINASMKVVYSLPEGGTLTTDSEGNAIGRQEIATEYHNPSIVTTAGETTYTLKMKR